MSETKYTPGPWIVGNNGHYPIVRKIFRPDHHMDICGPIHGYLYSPNESAEQQANARLIAAAPTLLSVTKALVDAMKCGHGRFEPCQSCYEAWKNGEAAIALAEGEGS